MRFMATTRIMRSCDYCHFEVSLQSDQPITPDGIDSMRNVTALLVDRGVQKYIKMKEFYSKKQQTDYMNKDFIRKVDDIKDLLAADPDAKLTPEQAAIWRSYEDEEFMKRLHEKDFFYDSDERDTPYRRALNVLCDQIDTSISDLPIEVDDSAI